MPHISLLPPDLASKESKAVYDEFYRRMQFPAPPNFILTQGHSSYVARGTWELVKNVLVGGEIARWKKEMIFVAISKERNCRYCLAAHTAHGRVGGVREHHSRCHGDGAGFDVRFLVTVGLPEGKLRPSVRGPTVNEPWIAAPHAAFSSNDQP